MLSSQAGLGSAASQGKTDIFSLSASHVSEISALQETAERTDVNNPDRYSSSESDRALSCNSEAEGSDEETSEEERSEVSAEGSASSATPLTQLQKARRCALLIVNSKYTEAVIMALILANCVTLSLEQPDKSGEKFFEIAELFFTVCFLLEATIKIIAKGLYQPKHAYLKNKWNILDFVIVMTNTVALFFFGANVSAVRMLRAFKALLMLDKAPGLKRVITATGKSLRSLAHLALMLLFIVVIHSIWAVQLWSGTWSWRCQSSDLGTNGQVCSVNNDSTFFAAGEECHDPWYSCVEFGNPHGGLASFDNFASAFLIVIQCVTISGWSSFLYDTMDANGFFPIVFFVTLVTLSSYCLLPLCVVIIKDAFHHANADKKPSQKKGFLRHLAGRGDAEGAKPARKVPWVLKKLLVFLGWVCPPLICINFVVLMIRHNGQPWYIETTVEMVNLVTAVIFMLEVILNLSVYRLDYLCDGFNLIDVVTAVLNIAEVMASRVFGLQSIQGLAALRAARLLRVVRALRTHPNLMRQAEGAIGASKRFSYFILVFIFVFTTSLMFMHTCGARVAGFSTLPRSILTSLQIITGDSWGPIMYETMLNTHWVTAFLFVFCHLCGHVLFNKLFLAVVLDYYESVYEMISGSKGYGRRRRAERQRRNTLEQARFLYPERRYPASYTEEFRPWDWRLQEANEAAAEEKACKGLDNYAADHCDSDGFSDTSSETSTNACGDSPTTLVTHKLVSVPQEYFRAPNLSSSYLRGLMKRGPYAQHSPSEGTPHYASATNYKMSRPMSRGISDRSCFTREESSRTNEEECSQGSPGHAIFSTKLLQAYERGIEARRNVGGRNIYNALGWSANLVALHATKPRSILPNEGAAFFVFPPPVRRMWLEFHSEPTIEHLAVVLAIIQSVAAAMEHNSPFLVSIDYMISCAFAAEALTKSIGLSFVLGKGAYLKDGWNVFDFVILVIVGASYVLKPLSRVGFVKILRSLRAMRPLRLLKRLSSVRSIAVSLLRIIPGIVTIASLAAFFYLVFAIIGVDLLGGQLYRCSIPSIGREGECVGQWAVEVEEYPFSKEHPYNPPELLVLNTSGPGNKTYFVEAMWMNEVQHFDHLGAALRALVTLSSLDNWRSLLDICMSSCGTNEALSEAVGGCRSNAMVAVFFISFIFVVAFFVVPVVTSEIVVTYLHVRREVEHTAEYSARELSYFYLMKLLFLMKPGIHLNPRKGSKLARQCHFVSSHPYFDNLIGIAIIVNIITMALEYRNMPDALKDTLVFTDYGFTILFLLEAVLKLIAFGFAYFKPSWNRFDFLLVSASVSEMILFVFLGSDSLPLNPFILRSLRAFLRLRKAQRLLRLVRRTKGIQMMFETMLASATELAANVFFYIVITLVYALLGVELFSSVKHSVGLNRRTNFDTFLFAMLTLQRVATGDNWSAIMENCMISEPDCSNDEGTCGYPTLAPLYFFSYKAFSYTIMVALFVATVMQTHTAMTKLNGLDGAMREMHIFMDTWSLLFSSATTIPTRQLQVLLSEIGVQALQRGDPIPPFALPLNYTRDDLMSVLKRHRFLDHKGVVSYTRILLEIAFYKVRSVGKGITKEEWWSFEDDWERLVPAIRLPVTRWIWRRYTVFDYYSALYIQQWYRFLMKTAKLRKVLAPLPPLRTQQEEEEEEEDISEADLRTSYCLDTHPLRRNSGGFFTNARMRQRRKSSLAAMMLNDEPFAVLGTQPKVEVEEGEEEGGSTPPDDAIVTPIVFTPAKVAGPANTFASLLGSPSSTGRDRLVSPMHSVTMDALDIDRNLGPNNVRSPLLTPLLTPGSGSMLLESVLSQRSVGTWSSYTPPSVVLGGSGGAMGVGGGGGGGGGARGGVSLLSPVSPPYVSPTLLGNPFTPSSPAQKLL